jgi:hypothetical protein
MLSACHFSRLHSVHLSGIVEAPWAIIAAPCCSGAYHIFMVLGVRNLQSYSLQHVMVACKAIDHHLFNIQQVVVIWV